MPLSITYRFFLNINFKLVLLNEKCLQLVSSRNTISVLELLTDIQSCVSVDPDVYSNVKRAVQNYQTTDGGFSDVDTTAFALSVLIQVGVENDVSPP